MPMNHSRQKGSAVASGILILAVIAFIYFITPAKDRGAIVDSNRDSFLSDSYDSRSNADISPGTTYETEHISLGSGNAGYAYQPYEEYITIDNNGAKAVNISGWQLRNGKDKRAFYSGGMLQRFSADVAVLPRIILGPGERAVITTGRIGVQTPYKIENFRENICTGYIEGHPDYAFTPPLSQNCPRPSEEPGIENLDRECRDFINTLSYCRMPVFENKDYNGEECSTCINGKRLGSVCTTFVKERYNYDGCLAYHGNDPKFALKTWRIFLGRGWEMWADKYETIELYNSLGQLVDYENY